MTTIAKRKRAKWKLKKAHSDGPMQWLRISSKNAPFTICEIPLSLNYIKEQTDNAHILCAAPDMLAALEEAKSFMQSISGGSCLASVLDAIAKAKGEKR